MPTKEEVIAVLEKIEDPEIGIDIWTLEMIYDIKIENGSVKILMTLTTPACPYGPMIINQVKEEVAKLHSVKEVEVEVTFNPPWTPSPQLRATLGV